MKQFFIFWVCIATLFGCSDDNNPTNTGTPNDPGTSYQASNEAVIAELNYARTQPAEYANHLEKMKQYFKGNRYELPGEIPLLTNEGVAAVQEAIDYLRQASPRKPLTLSVGLTKAAEDHRKDCGPKGITSHTGSDGSSMEDRINRYGTWDITIGENISFGAKNARDIVIQLIVDDGVKSRGHRNNIFNPQFTLVGTAFGYHKDYDVMCVMGFAGLFTEKSLTVSENIQ